MKEIDIYKFRNSFEDHKHVPCRQMIKGTVENPVFSIVIPAYKRAETLETAVKSALSQDFKGPYEVIVVNNDPAGKEEENAVFRLIKKISDSRVSYYVNDENIGMCGNWNRAILSANSDNIVMLHDDNVMSAFVLSIYYRFLQKYDDITVMGVGSKDYDQGKIPQFLKPQRLAYGFLTKQEFFHGKCLSIPALFFKKQIAIEIGGFPDEFYPNEDTIFIYQGILKGRVIGIENCLAGYGRGDNVSMKGDTMKQIVLTMEATRRCIAEYEGFARIWMRFFGRAYFWQYVCGAEACWNMELDKEELAKQSGYKRIGKYCPERILMRGVQKLRGQLEKLNSRKYSLEMEE